MNKVLVQIGTSLFYTTGVFEFSFTFREVDDETGGL